MKKTLFILTLTAAQAFAGKTTTDNSKHTTRTEVVTVYRTNYVQVPVVCATLDVADFQFEANRTYRLMVADGNKPWRNWGLIRSTTNTNARVWFPAASTRSVLWQLVDVTPGYPQVSITKQLPDCVSKPQWVILGAGNIRKAQ